eukprot:m.313484 g.313484  ORF g.313484 m.313484 type:complete len:207 (+) comp400796_c0_seq1:205-825(+)
MAAVVEAIFLLTLMAQHSVPAPTHSGLKTADTTTKLVEPELCAKDYHFFLTPFQSNETKLLYLSTRTKANLWMQPTNAALTTTELFFLNHDGLTQAKSKLTSLGSGKTLTISKAGQVSFKNNARKNETDELLKIDVYGLKATFFCAEVAGKQFLLSLLDKPFQLFGLSCLTLAQKMDKVSSNCLNKNTKDFFNRFAFHLDYNHGGC